MWKIRQHSQNTVYLPDTVHVVVPLEGALNKLIGLDGEVGNYQAV